MHTPSTSSSLKSYYTRLPHKAMPAHTYQRYKQPVLLIAGTAVSIFCVLNSFVALLQFNRMPLFSRAGDTVLSLSTAEGAKERLMHNPVPSLTLVMGVQKYTVAPDDIGLHVDTQATLRAAMDGRGWNMVPLLQVYHNARHAGRVVYAADQRKMAAYLKEVTPKENKAPTDAAIVIPPEADKAAYIVSEKAGVYFDASKVSKQIAAELRQHEYLTITVRPQSVPPRVSTRQLEPSLELTNRMLDTRLTLTSGGGSHELTATQIRPLVRLVPDEKGIATPTFDRDGMAGLVRSISGTFYKAPTPTVVTRVDGRTAGTAQGSAGHTLNVDSTTDAILRALQEGRTQQEVVLTSVPASTTYRTSYSPTSEGLYALIQDFAASHRGTYYVVARELSGNRAAYYNHHASVVPASIFKLFLAYAALHKIEQGQLQFDTQTSHGTVDHCIRQMIVISTDSCAIAVLDHIGRAEVDAVIHAAGFGATSLNNPAGEHKYSTANDIANILTGLHSGSLLSRTNSDYLLNFMRQQMYRRGIPAGSAGAPVADKVGVLYSWTHDAGIVYAPNSTYVLVVMTANGGGYDSIRELARSVYDIYNR